MSAPHGIFVTLSICRALLRRVGIGGGFQVLRESNLCATLSRVCNYFHLDLELTSTDNVASPLYGKRWPKVKSLN